MIDKKVHNVAVLDVYTNGVFDELYLKKHNIVEIASTPEEEQKMILIKNEILTKSQGLPSVLIKRKM